MKLFLYLFKKVFFLFLASLLFFAFVFVLVDLMMNLWGYISNSVSVYRVLKIMALYLPKTLWYSTPLAILFAVSYTLSDMYANNELIAVFCSGVSLSRFTSPLLIFALLMSVAMFVFDDRIVVPTYAKKLVEQDDALKKEKSLDNDRLVVLSEGGNVVYKADMYDDENKRLNSMLVVIRNEDKSLNSILRADFAIWKENPGYWSVTGGSRYRFENGEVLVDRVTDDVSRTLTERPETFQNKVVSVETVNVKSAREYISHLQKAGLPFAEQLSLYYKKFSFPFVLFIVVFLSIGLSGKTRKNVMLISLASSICASVLFYVAQMITMLLAKFEYISPFSGAWSPVFLFVVLASLVVRYART